LVGDHEAGTRSATLPMHPSSMDKDTQLDGRSQRQPLFSRLKCGEEETLAPRSTDERLYVTDVVLFRPGRAAVGESVVAACVEIGTRNLMLGMLSAENPCVKLQTPVELDNEFCFYVVRMEDGYAADDDADANAAVVEFQGFALVSPSLHTEEKDDYDHKEGQETDGEIDPHAARGSSAGGNGKDVRHVVARGFFGILIFVSMLASMM
uniref:Uncharacterized protein n=1 Tax=Aegilops tauschii subsp. strangulata TaxID=200361 RepID=A0A453T1Z5_AEGTS